MGSDGGPPPHTTRPHPLLPLLALPFFILPALAAATLPQWWPPLARLWRRRSRRLPCPPPALGLAAVYPLSWVYRNGDEFRSGLDAIRLDARPGPSLVPLSALLSPTADDCPPRWVVYCVEPAVDAVVLLEIAAAADLLAEPFLDRGVRCVAGAKAAVVGTETLAAWVEATYGGADNGDSGSGGDGGGGINPMVKGLTWVWNTGRCGSTLLHRVLLAAGVCSLSEPYWLEQLARLRAAGALGDEEVRRLLRLCLLADARLIAGPWMPQARVTSVNLKGIGHILLDLAHGLEGRDGRALFLGDGAAVKHLFMYRDMPPVVESLASVFHGHAPPSVRCLLYIWPRWALNLPFPPWSKRLRRVWRWLGLTAAHDEGNEDVKSAAEFQALAGSAALAMGEWGAARALALSWLDALATWVEVTELWPAIEDKATVRMEEFIHPSRRLERLAAVLRFLLGEQGAQAILEDEVTAARCLAVFGVHSQAGSRMQRSSAITGRRFLGPKVYARLRALLASAPDRHIASLRIPNTLCVPSIEEEREVN